jgi:hypothetical protein
MTGGSISNPRPTFETAADGAAAKGDDGSEKERKKREPKPPRRFYKTVEQVLSQPVIPATEVEILGLPRDNTTRKRLEERGMFPQRRMMPGCERMVFYRREDIIAHTDTLNDPRWNGKDGAQYKALWAGRLKGGGNAT